VTTTKLSAGRQTDRDFSGLEVLNAATPTLSGSLATKGYVDAVASGIGGKHDAVAATLGTETFTIASGSVTQIAGTTVDGVSPAIGDYVLIKDAPASTGVGSPGSTQPGNGLYRVTNATTNLTVTRADEMVGTNLPAGAFVFVQGGSTNVSSGWVVSSPTMNTGFLYGTTSIKFTQFSGAGEITVDSTITKTGNQLSRPAITGDISISTGSNSAAIGANKVTLAMLATLAANSVIGNSTGSTATPTAIPLSVAATASAIAIRDTNANVRFNNVIEGLRTQATAAGTTTLTASDAKVQQFTGATTQTVVLPDATTLSVGQSFKITNRSSGVVTVNANGGGLVQTMAAGSQTEVTVVTNGTAAGTWDSAYSTTAAGGVTAVSVASANGFAGSSSGGATPALTLTTTVTGVLKGNGTAISAATAGTDFMAPSSFVDRETPTGAVNGSNTTYTLANTPLSGSEHVYLNGILQEPGAGNDYTISGTTITYLAAPISGDKIRVSYRK
jgi:hypothetical protein